MQAVNKIHVSSATKISLNDRFTIIQTVGPKSPGPKSTQSASRPIRNRSRSRSRSQGREKASLQNRVLLQQLDQKHKMRTALRIKRKSLRNTLPARQRLGTTNQTRQRAAATFNKGLAATTRRVTGGRLKRNRINSNNIGTMQADLVRPVPRRRSNSTASIASRLGTRAANVRGGAQPQRRLNRSNIPPAKRSNSKGRASSQTRRSNSRGRLPAARDASAQRQRPPRQSRSVSRNRPNTPNLQTRRGAAAAKIRSRSRSRGRPAPAASSARSNLSVNARLGTNRSRPVGRQATAGGTRVIRGRVLKRRASNAGVGGVVARPQGRRGVSAGNAKQRLGRTRTRVAQGTNGRSRSASRGRVGQQQGKNNNQNVPRLNRSGGGGGGRKGPAPSNSPRGAGRSRSRRRGVGRPAGAASGPVKKEDLDKELDQYMVNTKALNDMDHLMI